MFTYIPQPANYDQRPELRDTVPGHLENIVHWVIGKVRKNLSGKKRCLVLVEQINRRAGSYKNISDQRLLTEWKELRVVMLQQGLTPLNIIQCFALVREFSDRVLKMRHYESQLMGGLILLQGKVAEMETGEGKTLTATLAASAMALAGVPVHVISVNDYLTQRDAGNMGALYRFMGISTGCVIHDVAPDQRRVNYLADVTYVTNKELVFDYLRDRLVLGNRLEPTLLKNEYLHSSEQRSKKLLLRGLHYGIVDEADSILIDEARTPLIISGGQGGDEKKQFFEQALSMAESLVEEEDYKIDRAIKRLRLTAKGKNRLEREAPSHGPLWNGMVRRESTVQQALTALHFFHLDEQYLLRDGKVQIIDEFTGRIMEDRSWEQGLHQLIELKEGCELTERRETMAKISYQRFFRRYLRLAGMTGTAKEVADELWTVYHLSTVGVAPHRPVQRTTLAPNIFSSADKKWSRIVKRIIEIHKHKRPVLIGTRSVAASEHLSQLCEAVGLDHQVLNAKQDIEEAEIISRAGKIGMITIATNMAGRGTDIILGKGVKKIGGLHVIITELHEAARIDRQLAGRCARQGDLGSYEAILSFDDILFEGRQRSFLVKFGKFLAPRATIGSTKLSSWAMKYSQQRIERYHARVRKGLFRQDQAQGNLLSFAGRVE